MKSSTHSHSLRKLLNDRPTESPQTGYLLHSRGNVSDPLLAFSRPNYDDALLSAYVPAHRHRHQPPVLFPPPPTSKALGGPAMRACTGELGVNSQPERSLKLFVKGVPCRCLPWALPPPIPSSDHTCRIGDTAVPRSFVLLPRRNALTSFDFFVSLGFLIGEECF